MSAVAALPSSIGPTLTLLLLVKRTLRKMLAALFG
jgi:hypothetical protein